LVSTFPKNDVYSPNPPRNEGNRWEDTIELT
jgi:hypothetical protein